MEPYDNRAVIVQDNEIVYDVFLKDNKTMGPGSRSLYIVKGITDEITKNTAKSLIDDSGNRRFILEKLKPGTMIEQFDCFILDQSLSNKCVNVYSFELPF